MSNIDHARRLREMEAALSGGHPIAFNKPYQEALEAGAQALERAPSNMSYGPDGAREVSPAVAPAVAPAATPGPTAAAPPTAVPLAKTATPEEAATAHAEDERKRSTRHK